MAVLGWVLVAFEHGLSVGWLCALVAYALGEQISVKIAKKFPTLLIVGEQNDILFK